MGFPAVYSEMPRLLLNLLFLLGHLRRLSSWLLRLVGAGVDQDLSFDYSDAAYFADHHHQHHGHGLDELEEHSPSVRFDALSAASTGDDPTPLLPEGCAVCLGDFHGAARVRRPRACRHVFHRGCLDRWASHGHRTCPLCRAPLLPSPTTAPVLLPLPAS
ncbi:RING-H2 zinc finger protein RHA1a [Hordeum vulgare]|uniref:Predicted protein n=1 Tax=Hordeum vulgare subsp. vulgare TaxID=112509 RepID=F2D6J9_HORVV|nr:brassinosteroid-responsive RING protein 1-like [Hordeum vulgare subsp. vulgare]KAE8818623.1 RING-H2 zinc finger protein RHA1a [Hordeum vulgare]KAI4990205.1 hypothetical protein ZWY2020_038568 [Hordeum vulgare]BAJ90720.1 predicted protein [Hordeum vulgare subsp. vulgare]